MEHFKDTMEGYHDPKILIYNDFNNELREKWLLIEKTAELYVFQRYSWNQYWSNIYSDSYDFQIVVVEEDGIPVVIYPLCINNKGIIRVLRFIGGMQSDYLMPICSEYYNHSQKTWALALKKIKRKFDIVDFRKIPENINGHKNNFLSIIKAKKSEESHYLRLPENIDEFNNSLKSNFRNDTKRQLKRIIQLGNVKFEKIDIYSSRFQQYIDLTIKQKIRRTQNSRGISIFDEVLFQDFYKNLFLLNDENFSVDYTILTLNDEILLASHLGFNDKKRFYYILPSIEGGEWNVYSCGRILIHHLIESTINDKHIYFDFTIGDENYKKDWCNSSMNIYAYKKHINIKGLIFSLCVCVYYHIRRNKYFDAALRSITSL